MCGRYSITTPPQAMQRLFEFQGATPNFGPRYNVAPTQDVPVVRLEDGVRRMALMRWGLIPSWSKDGPEGKPLINARSETAAEKTSFRSAFEKRHCLILADGFFEWQAGEKPPKQPYHIHQTAGGPFAMAGIWEMWGKGGPHALETVAILTTGANDALKNIHHRMPVILDTSDYDAWLNVEVISVEGSQALMKPAPNDFLVADPISTKVNKVANDDPSIFEPAVIETAPTAPKKPKRKKDDGQMSLL
jgi:putative SOS response-associated peptidase YedK